MIKRISAVALSASLLLPSPAAAQAVRAALQPQALAPSPRAAGAIPLTPAELSVSPAAAAPLALVPALSARPGLAEIIPFPAAALPRPSAAPAGPAEIIPFPSARVQAAAFGEGLAARPLASAEVLSRGFDGGAAFEASVQAEVAAARRPAERRAPYLRRAAALGFATNIAALPVVQSAVSPAAQGSSLPAWAGFALIGAGIVGLLFTVRWIEGSKSFQFYLARRRWATATGKKWSEAGDEEKARVERVAERIVELNKAGRANSLRDLWPFGRKDEETPAPPSAPERPNLMTPDGRPLGPRGGEDLRPAPTAAAAPKPGITFADVAGQQDAKRELEKVVAYIKDPEPYNRLGAKGFRGVLMFGPPGTGKTLLARAVAGEAGATFHETNGSEFVNTYVGKGPSNIRAAFAKARGDGKKPGILFIDEIDAVGKKRSDGEGNQEYENTLNALLAEMSSPANAKIVVIAATNRPELLDAALMRGRRFGLKVPVGLPDIEGREAILKVHAKNMPLAKDVSLHYVAELTPRLSGADLEEIINDAAMLAAERGGTDVNAADFKKAIERTTIGHERKLIMSAFEKKVVAHHESGHALVAWLVPNGDQIRKITIVPHGLNALGLVQTVAEEEKYMYSKAWLEDRIAIALGGRVGELLATGQTFSGAQNDFEQATRMARMMVMKFGMTNAVGQVSYDMEGERPAVGRAQSEKQRELIDREVRRIIDEQMARVTKLLTDNRSYLDGMAGELMARETLREDDLARLLPPRPAKQ